MLKHVDIWSRITWPMDLMECLHKRDIMIPLKMSHLRCIMEWLLLAPSSHRYFFYIFVDCFLH